MLTCYENLLERYNKDKDVIDQNRALQAIFDFKFFSSVFGDRSKTEVGCLVQIRFGSIVFIFNN